MQQTVSRAQHMNGTSHQSPISRRRINGRACVHCHERKTRCDILDKGAPCTSCVSRNLSGCKVYPKKKHRDAPIRSRDLVSIRPRRSALASYPSVPISPVEDISPPSTASASGTEAQDGENNDSNLEFIHREDVRARELDHQTRICFIGSGISNCNYLLRQSSPRPNEDGVLHFCNRPIHRRQALSTLQLIPPEALKLPDKKLADRLIRAYFDNVNSGWPIVDEELFMTQYEGKDPGNPASPVLLNAVFLVGAHVLASQDDSMENLKAIFFGRAKTLLDYRLEQDRFMYVQVSLLMTWYTDGLEEIIANSWHWIGMATRTALGLGMHRDITKCKMQAIHKRAYTRLWWILFQFDTIASASCGQPQALNLDDSDVPELDPSHFEGIPGVAVDFVIQQTKLCKIISRTMREWCALNASPETRVRAVQKADEALAQFLIQLPRKLQPSVVNLDTWKSMLHLTYNDFIIRLHRPPPKHNMRDQASETGSDPGLCGDATVTICSVLDSLLNNNSLSCLWFYTNHVLFTAMIHVSNEVGSCNPIVAAKSRSHFQSLMLALQELSRHWRYAQSLLDLFEHRALIWKRKTTTQVESAPSHNVVQDRCNSSDDFTLRPDPPGEASYQTQHPLASSSWAYPANKLQSGLQPTPLGITSTNLSSVSFADLDGGFLGCDDETMLDDLSFLDAFAYDFFAGDLDGENETVPS